MSLRTMLLMLRTDLLNRVREEQYRFCASPDCPVVYYSQERAFMTVDLRVRVGLKEKGGLIPVCYCFGFYEQDLLAEISTNGHTTIPQRITALVKGRLCACEVLNPSGGCCLGDVMRAVKQLTSAAEI